MAELALASSPASLLSGLSNKPSSEVANHEAQSAEIRPACLFLLPRPATSQTSLKLPPHRLPLWFYRRRPRQDQHRRPSALRAPPNPASLGSRCRYEVKGQGELPSVGCLAEVCCGIGNYAGRAHRQRGGLRPPREKAASCSSSCACRCQGRIRREGLSAGRAGICDAPTTVRILVLREKCGRGRRRRCCLSSSLLLPSCGCGCGEKDEAW